MVLLFICLLGVIRKCNDANAISTTFSALFFVVDQAQRDQFIFVDDLAGFLSCSFLQVSRTLITALTKRHTIILELTPPVLMCLVSCMLWLTSCSLLTVLWALLIAIFGMFSIWFWIFGILCIPYCKYAMLLWSSLLYSNCASCELQNT
jgi:hypothetical protein